MRRGSARPGATSPRGAKARPVPATLYMDLGPIERALRDEVDGSVARVLIDDRDGAAAARAYAALAMPEMSGKIEFYEGRLPLFEAFGIEDEIAHSVPAARAFALGRLDHHRGDRSAHRHRRQFGQLYRFRRAGRNQPEGQSRSRRSDRAAIAPARHRRADRDRFHPSGRTGQHSARAGCAESSPAPRAGCPARFSACRNSAWSR